MANINLNSALQVAINISRYLPIFTTKLRFNVITAPQQHNSVDCGPFSLYFIEQILAHKCYTSEVFVFSKTRQSLNIIRKSLHKCCMHKNEYLKPSCVNNFKEKLNTLPSFVKKSSNSQVDFSTNKLKTPTSVVSKSFKSPVTNKKIKRVFISTDSNGRGVSSLLHSHLGDNFNVTSSVHPGAKLSTVIKSVDLSNQCQSFTKTDFVIILGGTNDVDPNFPFQYSLLKNLSSIKNLTQQTNVIFIAIPPRFDESCYGSDINIANYVLLESFIQSSTSNLVWLNWHGIARNNFSSHGLHLNARGKVLLAKSLYSLICSTSSFCNNIVIKSFLSLSSSSNLKASPPKIRSLIPRALIQNIHSLPFRPSHLLKGTI